jgi:hypothetical protein
MCARYVGHESSRSDERSVHLQVRRLVFFSSAPRIFNSRD